MPPSKRSPYRFVRWNVSSAGWLWEAHGHTSSPASFQTAKLAAAAAVATALEVPTGSLLKRRPTRTEKTSSFTGVLLLVGPCGAQSLSGPWGPCRIS
jgi:hypothetical protein